MTTFSDVNLSVKALTAVVERGSLSLAMTLLLVWVTLSLVSMTTCSGMYLSAKALKAVMKLESLSLALKLSLLSVTTCSDMTC